MRVTILIGLVLIVMGGMALYQVRNGFFMSMVGHAIYAPPENPSDLQAAFSRLGGAESETPGVTLAAVAEARLDCALRLTEGNASGSAREAFRRFNLMLLGVGIDSYDPVIDPQAYRLTELRRGLTRDALPWVDRPLNSTERKTLYDIYDNLQRADHPAYSDLQMQGAFSHYDFTKLANRMMAGAEEFHDCVTRRRLDS